MYSRAERPAGDGILIVGGYGQVGALIAMRMAALFPGRVSIAGRSLHRAKAAADAIGRGTTARAMDVRAPDAPAALDGIAMVLVCLDQTSTRFVEQCLSRGIHYVDISADYRFLKQVEDLNDLAQRSAASAVLSVGTAPGLSNMLAARVRERMEEVERIDILLELGLGDHHGKAALEWMFDNLDAEYEVRENGKPKVVSGFSEAMVLRLPGEAGGKPAYRFNFSDQRVVARTLDIPTVSTWIRFDGRVSTWLFAKASRAGLGRLLRARFWRKVAVWLFTNVHVGSDRCGVAVRATGRTKDGEASLTLGVIGRGEALMTAIIAAESARQVLSLPTEPGVRHSEQALSLDPIISALSAELPDILVSV